MRAPVRALLLMLSSSGAYAQAGASETSASPFDPSSYLLETQGSEQDDIKAKIVEIHGQRYRKYESDRGVLYVPILGDRAKPDKALCMARGEERAFASDEVFIGWQEKEADAVSLDLRAVGQVLRDACSGRIVGIQLVRNPLEIGITVRTRREDGERKVRIFNRGLKPNIGIGTEF